MYRYSQSRYYNIPKCRKVEIYPEESGRGSTIHGSVSDFRLFSKIFDTLDWIFFLVVRQEGGQIGSI